MILWFSFPFLFLSFEVSQRRWSDAAFLSLSLGGVVISLFTSGMAVENQVAFLLHCVPTSKPDTQHSFSSLCVCACKHTRSLFFVHSQKRLDMAVFSSVEIGTVPSPVNNSLTSAHAVVIAAELERVFSLFFQLAKLLKGYHRVW